jgi:tetratricopeptide (TPR) repeat protein
MLGVTSALRVFVILAALGASAYAQKGATKDAERARALYDAGRKAYNLGDFDLAIESWKQGYNLKDDPVFLYNIAQAYRQKEDLPKALFFYKSYLREARDAPFRAEVEERVAEIQKALELEKAAATAPPSGAASPSVPEDKPKPEAPPPVEPPPAPTPASPPVSSVPAPTPAVVTPLVALAPSAALPGAPAHPGRTWKIAGLVSAGVGVALVGTGLVLARKHASIASDIEDASKRGETWTSDLEDKDAEGRRAATLSQVTLGVGVAALVGGGVMYFLGRSRDARGSTERARLELTPMASPMSATLGATWHF